MKISILRILGLLLLSHASVDAQQPCKTLQFKGVFEGHAYFYSDQELSWQAANSIAIAMGGHLAVISSEDENDFVAQTVLNGSLAWIGLKETSKEGRFAWASGKRLRYTNWGPHEPNNAGGSESWTEINRGGLGKWNDMPAGFTRGFVVEFESGDLDNDGIADVCDPDIHTEVVGVAPAALAEETDRNEPEKSQPAVPTADALSLQLSPNPASQEVQLRFSGFGDGEATLVVSDVLGRVVLKKMLDASLQDGSFPLSLSSFTTGEYFVQVFSAQGMVSKVLTVTGK